MSDEEYICKNCGEPWDGEQTPFYVEGKCKHCGAPKPTNKVRANKNNPLLRDEDE